jgi:hypothetical protein
MESNLEVEQKDSDPPAWLARIWKEQGEPRRMEIDMGLWLEVYPDLVRLIENYPGIEAYPNKGCLLPDGVTPASYDIKIKPKVLEALHALAKQTRPGPRTHARQVTDAEGKHYDTRNGLNQIILDADPEALNKYLAPWWLKNLDDPYPRKSNASEKALQAVLALRFADLSPDLLACIQNRIRRVSRLNAGEGT